MRTARHRSPFGPPQFTYQTVTTAEPVAPADLAELEACGWTLIGMEPVGDSWESTFRQPVPRPGTFGGWAPGRRPGRRR